MDSSNGLIPNSFKLPDNQKKAGNFLTLLLIGGLGYLLYKFLPVLVEMAENTLYLGLEIAGIVLIGYILLNKKFRGAVKIMIDAIGKILFGWFIEMNPFTIMGLQIDETVKDREKLQDASEKLKGQQAKLDKGLKEKQEQLRLNKEKIDMLKEQKAKNPSDYKLDLQITSATSLFTGAKGYIDSVAPIYNDISGLVRFADLAYDKSGYALDDARNQLKEIKDQYEAVTMGAKAMQQAQKAFMGNPQLNDAASVALSSIGADIANKIGVIRNSIKITSQIMSDRDLNDAAKVRLALNDANGLQLDSSLDKYVDAVKQTNAINGTDATNEYKGNQYLDFLK